MNVTLLLALLLASPPTVETSPTRTTRLYVRTLPAGAEVQVDGQSLGRSDGLFLVPPGVHRVTVELDGFDGQTRQIEILDGRITRVELAFPPRAAQAPVAKAPAPEVPTSQTPTPEPSPGELCGDPFADESPTPVRWVADDRVFLGYVHDASLLQRPLLDGAAVCFRRPAESNQLLAVEVYGGRSESSSTDGAKLLVSVLDECLNMLHQTEVPVPEAKGSLQWITVPLERTKVPEQFFITITPQPEDAFSLGIDPEVSASHSYTGTPKQGLTTLAEKADWMTRAVLTPPPSKAEIR